MTRRICKIIQDCEGYHCKNDLYFISGYITDSMEVQLPGWKFPDRRVFECDTKYEEYGHDLDKVVKRFRKGVLQNSKGQRIDMVSYSWGGFVAQEYSQRWVEDVNKIALINGFSRISEWAPVALQFVKEIGVEPRIINSIETIEKSLELDFSNNDIKVPTFTYNCLIDWLAVGFPPNIKDAKNVIDLCLHTWSVPENTGKANGMVNKFLEES